ncbi:MAG: sensor histidine kinase [Bacteriovoracia bacterium]
MILNALLAVYGALALVDILFMTVLHFFHDRRGYYKTAAGIWVGTFLSYAADGFISEQPGGLYHIFGFPFLAITSFSLARLTSDLYGFRFPYKKLFAFFALAWISGVSLHYIFRAGFAIESLAICIGIVAPMLLAAGKLLSSPKKLNVIDKIFGVSILVQGLHILDYPFLRNIPEAAVFGFSFGLLLVYVISVVIPVVINKRIHEDLNHSLEEKVKERTAELLEAKAHLLNSARMAALGEMAGGVAHEINNPLAIIKMVSATMTESLGQKAPDRKELRHHADMIEQTTNRIAKIVHGLRTFSREGSNDLFEEVPLEQVIGDTIGLCQERFRSHAIRLIVDQVPKQLSFEGRATNISQVLLNLLNNAHDAIISLPEKWIHISVREEGSWLEVQVTDSGKGIPTEVREKIFRPFFTTKEVGKGTGLGLSVSLGIVKAHRGELTIDATSPNTRFLLRLPKKQARQPIEPRLSSGENQ